LGVVLHLRATSAFSAVILHSYFLCFSYVLIEFLVYDRDLKRTVVFLDTFT
jgi:hypothetical protein